ncbi:MAG TPA: hypothetical protein VGL83_18120 [Stellaceae bacterium]|jgi:hypothetical protein
MKMVTYAAALALVFSTAACSNWFGDQSSDQNAQTPFSNGLRTSPQQPTSCSPADATCGSGIGNPSVQSPTQKRLMGTQSQ